MCEKKEEESMKNTVKIENGVSKILVSIAALHRIR